MEFFQIVWGVFALAVVWSVFFMPPLFLGVTALVKLLQAQQVIVLAGALSLWFIPLLWGSPEGFWAAYGDLTNPLNAVFLLAMFVFLMHQVRNTLVNTSEQYEQEGKDAFQSTLLQTKRFPVWPDQLLQGCVHSFCEQIGLRLDSLIVIEAEPLPYKEAKPDTPNAGATGSAFSGVGVVIFSSELLAKLHPRCLDAVIIHELAHIKNNDILRALTLRMVSFAAVCMPFLAAVLYGFSLGSVLGTLVAAFLLEQALSRKKEALADTLACQLGYGDALAKALETIRFEGEHKKEKPFLQLFSFLSTHPKTNWRTKMCRTLRF